MNGIHERAERLLERELERFEREHPRSGELARRASSSLLAGVPMHWMVRWPGAYPVFASEAAGARFRDVDGIEYVDFCLGDTGAMTGHSPEPVVRAVAEQAARGITLMLPSEEALWVGEELTRRFGLARWQRRPPARPAHPPVRAQPRRAPDAVSQHGAHFPGHDRGGRRPPHRGLRRDRAGAHRPMTSWPRRSL